MNAYKAANIWVMNDIRDTVHRRGEGRRLVKKARRVARKKLKTELKKWSAVWY